MFIKNGNHLINIGKASDIFLSEKPIKLAEGDIYRITVYFNNEGNQSIIDFKNLDVAKKAFESISNYLALFQGRSALDLEGC